MAYGARLESVLGASPRGFESPILRHRTPEPLQVPGFLCPMVSLAGCLKRLRVSAGGDPSAEGLRRACSPPQESQREPAGLVSARL